MTTASQPGRQPGRQAASQPASQPTRQPASHPAAGAPERMGRGVQGVHGRMRKSMALGPWADALGPRVVRGRILELDRILGRDLGS